MNILRFICLITLLVLNLNSYAQQLSASNSDKLVTLSGTIYDQQGSLVPNATVKLKAKNNKQYEIATNKDGIYEFEIPAGVYSIEVTSNNFKTFKIKKYFVSPSYQGKMFFDVALLAKGLATDTKRFF